VDVQAISNRQAAYLVRHNAAASLAYTLQPLQKEEGEGFVQWSPIEFLAHIFSVWYLALHH
jgi:hypothetical protein